ncbi:MAG: phytanoyl-CoA dioxygenase family protein [Candidatus Latescibacterota bacterium]|nr:phytanoyl-CoA dioxygenase family protein [Candidatus Latescibacterota bacterium]
MECIRLKEEQRRCFEENGYLVVSGALTGEEVARLTEVSDQMIEAFGREEDQYYVQRRPGIVEEPAFHPLLAHAATVALVVQLLSPNIHLHTTAIIYKYPQAEEVESSRGWHRDIGMTEDLGHANIVRAGIKVGYCLTDFSAPETGFTMFAPGSHLIPTPLPIPKGEVDPENAVDLCLKAGDAVLFENRVFHTAAPNLSQRTAKVVILGYSYRWMGGRGDQMRLVQPGDEVLDQVDDIGVQLLGGASDALVHWAKEQEIAPEPVAWTMEV